jgi:hypothetical protein
MKTAMSRSRSTERGLRILIRSALLAPVLFACALGAADHQIPGAVGNGQTDDTTALQRAIDAGGAVRLPRGVYRITRSIVVDLDKSGPTSLHGDGVARLVMAGAGPAIRLVGTHAGSANPSTFKPNVLDRQRMPLVDGLEIVGAHDAAVGIEANGVMQLTVTRTLIRDCLHGIHLTGNNRNITISNCHVYRNRGIGVFYDSVNLHQSNIVGCHISYCDGGGVVILGGAVRNVHIGTCDIESNQGEKNPPTANVLIDSSTSPSGTAEVAISGCTIQHNAQAVGSANIRVIGRGTRTPRSGQSEQWGQIAITGNLLSDVATNVHLKDTRGVTLTGNTFFMGIEHNLVVEDSQQIVVGANVFERNPVYDYARTPPPRNAIVFRNNRDCTISGLHVQGVKAEAGLVFENCDRFNITGCTILDCDNAGLLARNLTRSQITACMVRDDREKAARPLVLVGGRDNQIDGNLLRGMPE